MNNHYKKPLYLQMKEYLIDRIRQMNPGDNQLEPENLLAKKLGMSRETVRKAMSILIQEGLITRWHGKGNFGHPAVGNLVMRIDINSDFRRLLRNAGYNVKTIRSEPSLTAPSPQMLKRMPASEGETVMSYELGFFADNRLAIHARAELLNKYIKNRPESGEYTEILIDSLKHFCGLESVYSTAWQKAGNNSEIAQKFGIDAGSPILMWDEVYYDLNDFEIGYVEIHFNPEIIDIAMRLTF